jgi:hypothetical protein
MQHKMLTLFDDILYLCNFHLITTFIMLVVIYLIPYFTY